jgi:MFS family permease
LEKPRLFYGWYMVAASFAMSFLTGSVAVSLFFKPMLEDFGFDRATLSSVQSVGLIIFVILSPFLGKIIDRFGPKVMILGTVATQVLSRVINGIATNIWHLYLARLLYGINFMIPTQVLINQWFRKRRGLALGLISSANPLGTMLFAPVTQFLILTWGWRLTMLFWALIALIVMVPSALIVTNRPQDRGYSPDGVYPVEPSSQQAPPAAELDSITERGHGLSEAMKSASFWFLMGSQFICGLGCGFIMTHIVIFATDVGYSDMTAASLVSVQGISCCVGIVTTGALSDKIARKNVLSLAHFIRATSHLTVVTFLLIGDSPLWLLYLAMTFFGFGWVSTAPLSAGLVPDLFGGMNMGTIIGLINSFHMLGMAISAYAGGLIFEITGSYFLAFLSLGFFEMLAALFAFLIRLKRTESSSGGRLVQ